MSSFPLKRFFPKASRLIYGCMGLGGRWDHLHLPLTKQDVTLANHAVDAALESGITLFDHADIYTGGKAEQVFGQILRQRKGLREQLILQSKCGIRFEDSNGPGRYDLSAAWISESVDNILQRLGTDYLDILLLHRPDPLMEPEEVARVVEQLQHSGKVKEFGVSNMQYHQVKYLQSCLARPLVVNQLALSLGQTDWLDEGVLVANPVGKDLNFTPGTLEYCRQSDIQIQSWGSLDQGRFTGREVYQETDAEAHTAELVATLADHYGSSREAIVLAWLMRYPARIQPVIGTTNSARIHACAQSMDVQLTREQWYRLYIAARGNPLS